MPVNSTWESLRKVGVPDHLITKVFLLTSSRPMTREEIEQRVQRMKERRISER